jgi:hypothetical protein
MRVAANVALLTGVSVGGIDIAVGVAAEGSEVEHPVKTPKVTIITKCWNWSFISISNLMFVYHQSVCTSNAPMSQGVLGEISAIGRNAPR